MQPEWQFSPVNPEKIDLLVHTLRTSSLVAQLLIQRGLAEPGLAHSFLNDGLQDLPDPFLLTDMAKAVQRIVHAVGHHEKIVIYGDYDVDGATATTLLCAFFRALDLSSDYYIPHRLREGYSLNQQALETLAGRGCRVLITVDNGIAAHEGARLCRELGMDLIITDHHEPKDTLPLACAVINPLRAGDCYPDKRISGVGVAFLLLLALRRRLRETGFFAEQRPEPNLLHALDLVAVGTIADVVPLIGVNRILVREGLKVLTKTRRPGLVALKRVAALGDNISAYDVGFRLGPRINAIGRLDAASLGVDLLLAPTLEAALPLAAKLNHANHERQDLEKEILAAAMQQAQEILSQDPELSALVLHQPHWHVGVVGIVAARIVERFGRPTLVLGGQDLIKGSARSVGKFHILRAIEGCQDFLLTHGGHRYAAGVSLHPNQLASFRQAFAKTVADTIDADDLVCRLSLDAEMATSQITPETLAALEPLAPFGSGNPEPTFATRNLTLIRRQLVGKDHLRLALGEAGCVISAMAFRQASLFGAWQENSKVDVAYRLTWNDWQGERRMQMVVRDMRLKGSLGNY